MHSQALGEKMEVEFQKEFAPRFIVLSRTKRGSQYYDFLGITGKKTNYHFEVKYKTTDNGNFSIAFPSARYEKLMKLPNLYLQVYTERGNGMFNQSQIKESAERSGRFGHIVKVHFLAKNGKVMIRERPYWWKKKVEA